MEKRLHNHDLDRYGLGFWIKEKTKSGKNKNCATLKFSSAKALL
jgi:hypothetical protein